MIARARTGLSGLLIGLALMACNLQGIPVTPTLAPTHAITQTVIAFPPTETASPSPTITLIRPSATITPSRTLIDLISTTEVPTDTPSQTPSLTPSHTSTFTATASASVTPPPSDTPTLSPSTSPSVQPSPTSSGILTATPLNLPPTSTPFPTVILIFNTATPPPSHTPSPAPITPFMLLTTPTLVPSPAPFNVPATNLPGTPLFIAPLPTATPPVAVAGVFPTAISLDDRAEYVEIPEGSLQRPAPEGEISAYDLNRSGRRAEIRRDGRMTIDGSIYVGDNKHTRQQFIAARWSPDGNWLAYIVQTPGAVERQITALQSIDDGVWVLEVYNPTAKPRHILRNHYVPGSNEYPYRVALNLSWASDSDAILVNIIGQGGTPGVVLTGRSRFANEREPGLFQTLPYVGASWLNDGGWIAATSDPTRSTQIGVVDRRSAIFSPILDGAAVGLGISYPMALADGRVAFLGLPSATGRLESGALGLRLYVYAPGSAPQQVSIPLEGAVLSAEWNPAHTALLVNLRAYDGSLRAAVMGINGGITYLTSSSAFTSWRR